MEAQVQEEVDEMLPAEWQRWLAENLMLDMDRSVLIDTMASAGYNREPVEREADRVLAAPAFVAAQGIAERLRKMESLLAIYRQLASLSDPRGTLERRTHVTATEFLHLYYARNRPVLLSGLAQHWPACRTWTPEYLRGQCGNEVVEVMLGREADHRYEVNSEVHKQQIRFADYVDMVASAENSNDLYLVANNHFLDLPGTRHLADDLRILPDYLAAEKTSSSVFLWFGPCGTITPLHHDTMNVLLVQLLGHKRVTLIPSAQLPLVYNDVGVFSQVNAERPDQQQYPLFANTDRIELTLQAGDGLFIPVGWWHHVRSLNVSISVSFTNFIFPNDYQWQHPNGPR
jgi:ribosomal protein L16 Arg81 hydroxylase